MKVYISTDIEGICGVTVWDETEHGKTGYSEAQRQMTAEVKAACEGALAAGATEILVKDAHATGRNILATELPGEVQLIRGWSGHPYSMVQELDNSIAAVLFVGYHARAGSAGNPLSHTMSSSTVDYMKINGVLASEFLLHSHVAGMYRIPLVFLSGDEDICNEARELVPGLTTVAVKKGVGRSTVNIHPGLAITKIRAGVESALKADFTNCVLPVPASYTMEIRYKNHDKAYRASFYPGARSVDSQTIQYTGSDYFDVMRFRSFVI